eukprot:364050-Chlamydomonas_euryale.AAC.21
MPTCACGWRDETTKRSVNPGEAFVGSNKIFMARSRIVVTGGGPRLDTPVFSAASTVRPSSVQGRVPERAPPCTILHSPQTIPM